MSAGKTRTLVALLAKLESSYGGGGTLSASTDAIQLAPGTAPALTPSFVYDGDRQSGNGTSGRQRRNVPKGAQCTLVASVEVKGRGSAYSGSNFANDLHPLLRACGYGVTTVTTGGSESHTYAPISGPGSVASLVFQGYSRGETHKGTHGLGSFRITQEGLGPAIAEFTLDAVWDVAAIADAAVPAITYPLAGVLPPTGAGSVVQLGSFAAAIARSWVFDAGRERSPRVNLQAADGHAGWTLGPRSPTLEVVIETAALVGTPFHTTGGIDPWRLWQAANTLAVNITHGTAQYNRFKVQCPTAQLVGVTPEEDGETALTRLTFVPTASGPQANDDHTLVFD